MARAPSDTRAVNQEQIDRALLDAVFQFAVEHPDPKITRFNDSMRNWGDVYQPVRQAYLPAADCLTAAVEGAESPAKEILALFETHKSQLFWEQSYKKEDNLVPDAMLANYGFAEVLGSRGPFVSNRIRAGIGIYGPGVHYPRHQHKAEEIYLPLSGTAKFTIGDISSERGPGNVAFVSSNTPHGFTVGPDQALIVYYLWQAGDLRQTSSFG